MSFCLSFPRALPTCSDLAISRLPRLFPVSPPAVAAVASFLPLCPPAYAAYPRLAVADQLVPFALAARRQTTSRATINPAHLDTPGSIAQFYNTFFKRNSVFVPTIFVAAFGFTIGFDLATSAWWDKHNYPKQWKDIRAKYIEADADEE